MTIENLRQELLNEYNENSIPTSNERKDLVEKQVFSIIKDIAFATKTDYGITLVGQPNGLERHLNEFASIGINQDKLIIVEGNYGLYKKLYTKIKRKGYTCQIENGDFKEILLKHLSSGKRFSFVDFDATSNVSQYEFDMIDVFNSFKNKIKAMRLVVSGRGGRAKKGEERFSNIVAKNMKLKTVYIEKFMRKNIRTMLLDNPNVPEEIKNDLRNEMINSHNNLWRTIYTKTYPQDDIVIDSYSKSFGFNVLTSNYKGAGDNGGSNMKNIIISYKDLSRYQDDFYDNDFNKFVKQQNIFGNKIKVFMPDLRLRTQFFNIDNNIYHTKYGFLCSIN